MWSFVYRIPTLQDLGFSERETLFRNYGGWIGGETMALKRFTEYCNVRSRPTSDSSVSREKERERGGGGGERERGGGGEGGRVREGGGERGGGGERERKREREGGACVDEFD